jgi:hypothetical protein
VANTVCLVHLEPADYYLSPSKASAASERNRSDPKTHRFFAEKTRQIPLDRYAEEESRELSRPSRSKEFHRRERENSELAKSL